MEDMIDIFQPRGDSMALSRNPLIKAVSRLKGRLRNTGFPADSIQSGRNYHRFGYFGKPEIGWMIIHRSDMDFILGG